MTKLPLENRSVFGAPGPRYKPEYVCAHPFCDVRRDLELHHIWRRSFLGGAFNWVRVPKGGGEPLVWRVIGNVVYLCNPHHREITENRASIQWNTLEFVWDTGAPVRHALNPQPPLGYSEVCEPPNVFSSPEIGSDIPPLMKLDVETGEVSVVAPEPGENCPTCERRVPHPKKESSPKTTVVKSWRLPAEEKEAREETIAATAEHLGISTKEKFWMDKLILHLCVLALQGPGNDS